MNFRGKAGAADAAGLGAKHLGAEGLGADANAGIGGDALDGAHQDASIQAGGDGFQNQREIGGAGSAATS